MANWLSFQIADTGMFNGQQVVSKANLDETRKGQIEVPGLGQYGFGWMVIKVIYGMRGYFVFR